MAQYAANIGSQYRLILDVNTSSQNVANNTSTLSYRLSVQKISGYGYWTSVGQAYSIKVNGNTVKSGTWTYDFNNYKSKMIASGTITLTHTLSGSLSIQVSATTSMYSIGNATASGIYTGTKINRGVDNFVFKSGWSLITEYKSITFVKPDSSTKVQLEWKYWNNKVNTWSNTRIQSTNYIPGTNFTFSSEDINLMHTQNPNHKTVKIEVTIKSYNDGTLSKTISRSVELKLKEEVPTINSLYQVEGINQSLLGDDSYAIKDIHTLRINQSATAKNGATIISYTATFQNSTLSGIAPVFSIKNTGVYSINVKVTDSRGLSSTKQIGTITVRDYSSPTISGLKIGRRTNGIDDPIGTTGFVSATIKTSNVNNSSGSNINKPYWKISWSSTKNDNNNSVYATTIVPTNTTKLFTLEFGDNFRTLNINGIIPRGGATLVLGKESVGVNTIPPKNGKGLYIDGGLINGCQIPMYEDFTSKCSKISEVTNLIAIKYGQVAFLRFYFKPTKIGYTDNLITITDTKYRTQFYTVGTVFPQTASDAGKGNYGCIIKSNGTVSIIAPSVPTQSLICTIIYIIST